MAVVAGTPGTTGTKLGEAGTDSYAGFLCIDLSIPLILSLSKDAHQSGLWLTDALAWIPACVGMTGFGGFRPLLVARF